MERCHRWSSSTRTVLFICFLTGRVSLLAWGYPTDDYTDFNEDPWTSLLHYRGTLRPLPPLNCTSTQFTKDDVIVTEDNSLFLKDVKVIIPSSEYRVIENETILICPGSIDSSVEEATLNCTEKFGYESDEFTILPNGSALVHGSLIPKEEFMFKGEELQMCIPDDSTDHENNAPSPLSLRQVSIHIGHVGNVISIIALILYLLTFCLLPSLRNLPGYNLASLSVAFLLGYLFSLIGQIPEVLGLFCVICAVLQQNFFLVAFFCMNVLAFDVWRTLKLADKLIVSSQNTKKRYFLWYTLYAWGFPLIITITSVLADNYPGVPDKIRPKYGDDDTCWMTNGFANLLFFSVPAFALILVNGVFFVYSFCLISRNSMKCNPDQSRQTVKLNYILYVRLGIMMGLTWLVGIVATIAENEIVWFVFGMLNALQGLFLFVLFACTRKVLNQLKEKMNFKKVAPEKITTLSTNSATPNSRF